MRTGRGTRRPVLLLAILVGGLATSTTRAGSENRIDVLRPDAPELAAFGDHAIGVRTLDVVHPDQIDLVELARLAEAGDDTAELTAELPRYDRPLVLEVWYPAVPGDPPTPYDVVLRDGITQARIHGRATRDAAPWRDDGPYPLVIVSHGYPGNRFLLSHLAENLASKGYVVVSIDHTDSTYRTRAAFASTLVNRSLDQLFVLEEMARRSARTDDFLSGLVDAERTGLIGYSMGGYGAVITAGGGVTAEAAAEGAPRSTLAIHRAGSPEHEQRFDERIRAVVAFAPWGMERDLWDAEGLAGMRVPTLFVVGTADEVSGYEAGVRAIFLQATGIDRALLTFENAGHNAAAPMPAPLEAYPGRELPGNPFFHYADPVWDTVRMNNIAWHFVTAWLGRLLRDDLSMEDYLRLVTRGGDGVWSVDEDGTPRSDHSYWRGFGPRAAVGLRWERRAASP